MVGLVFLPQNFGPLVELTNGLKLLFCERTWGAGSISRWWGQLNTIYMVIKDFVVTGGGDPKTYYKITPHPHAPLSPHPLALPRSPGPLASHLVKLSLPDI